MSEASEASDAVLVGRVLGGSRDDYGVLVGRHQARLYRHALGMVRDPDAAADLVQDAFIRGYTRLASCHEPAHFGTWLFTIMRNRCTDYLREHRRRDVPLDPEAPFASSRGGPAEELDRAETAAEVTRALATLPEPQREAFLLKHVEGLSYDEMSGMLGLGVSALKMRVARAREGIRAALSGLGYGGDEPARDPPAGHPSNERTKTTTRTRDEG